MGYTVHFFALDSREFAERLKSDADDILKRTRLRLRKEGDLSRRDLECGLTLAAAICRGDVPAVCSEDHFWALCWIAETELESISVGVLIDLKRFSFIEEIGIWPLLGRWRPPFPVPKAEKAPPAVGFLPRDQNAATAIPTLQALPNNDEDVRYARQQVLEVLESLDEDGLDLLAILV